MNIIFISKFNKFIIIIYIIIFLAIFLITREFWCWYYKSTEIKDKLSKACAQNGLTFTVQNKGYPFLLTIKPMGGMDAQQAMIEGMEDAAGTGYISPDASLVFAYRDGDLTYKISETWTISANLFNKLKNLFQKLHAMWMQYFYRDVYEHSPHLAPENRSSAQAEASDTTDEEDVDDAFADFMDTAEPAEDIEYGEDEE